MLGYFFFTNVSFRTVDRIIRQLCVYGALLWLLLQLFCVTHELGFHVRVCKSNIYYLSQILQEAVSLLNTGLFAVHSL